MLSKVEKTRNRKNIQLKCVYGITLKQYKEMVEKQNGVCAICGKPEMRKSKKGWLYELQVDHNHKTNKIRGLLCLNCNAGLGNFKDTAKLILKAAKYLTREVI